jgi:hypothetical protein
MLPQGLCRSDFCCILSNIESMLRRPSPLLETIHYAVFRDFVSLSHLSLAPKMSPSQAAMLTAVLSFRVACDFMRSLCT